MTRKLFHDSRQLHERAEEARRVAVQIYDPYSRRTMLDIAETYENLARRDDAMGAPMAFSKYDAEAALMEAMRAAFKRACDALQFNGRTDDLLTDLIVMKIVAAVKAGGDPGRLCIDVLAALESPSSPAHPPPTRGH
jgi:hypothetical protein